MKHQTRTAQLIASERRNFWTDFQIHPMRTSMDISMPPLYLIDVQGLRGDGVAFTVTVSIDKNKYDLLLAKDALNVARGLINNGIRQLMQFTGCLCTSSSECDTHKKPLLQ